MDQDETYNQHHHHSEGDGHHHHHKSRRKKSHVLRNCLIVVAVLAVLIGGVGAAYYSVMGRIGTIETVEYVSPDEEEFETDEDAGEDTVTPEDIEWPDDPVETKDDEEQSGVTNVLIIGQDTRTPGERERSDSMIVISLNWDAEEVNMISIMRDLYVQIPGYSDNRINASYQFGGAELLDEVIEKNFGVHIDYNVEIDFTGFQEIIDYLGGVYVTLTSTEASYFQKNGYDAVEGINHMDGDFALEYARTRYVATATEANDFGRTERQRAVIESIFEAYGDVSTAEKISALYQILDLVKTDMSNSQIISLAYQVLGMNLSSLGSYRIPVDGGYTNQVIRSMEVLVPDLEANRTAFSQMIAGTYKE